MSERKRIAFRLDRSLAEALTQAALDDGRTVNSELEHLVRLRVTGRLPLLSFPPVVVDSALVDSALVDSASEA